MKQILATDLHRKWLKIPEYKCEFDALELEFTLAAAAIKAGSRAALFQEKLAKSRKATRSPHKNS